MPRIDTYTPASTLAGDEKLVAWQNGAVKNVTPAQLAVYAGTGSGGGTTTPGGTSGQFQVNSSGTFGGVTFSGDVTVTNSGLVTLANKGAANGPVMADGANKVPVARLPLVTTGAAGAVAATGTASGKFLRDDNSWQTIPAGLTTSERIAPVTSGATTVTLTPADNLRTITVTGSISFTLTSDGTLSQGFRCMVFNATNGTATYSGISGEQGAVSLGSGATAIVFMANGTLRAIEGSSNAVGSGASLLARTQPYSQPAGPIPTDNSVQPYGVTLVSPSTNTLNATFGHGGTIADYTTLKNVFYFRNNEGDLNATTSYPNQGASGNWEAVYRNYPPYMSDGSTPDPANLHVLQDNWIDLIARTRVASSFDLSRYEMGYLRAPVGIVPGSYAECCCRWPSIERDGISARYSWPTFWFFSTYQAFGGTSVEAANPSLEIDCFDGFPFDNDVPGSSIVTGAPLYTDSSQWASVYDTPTDQSFGSTHYRPDAGSYGGAGSARLYPISDTQDPTKGFHVYALDWRDENTILWLIDGEVVRKRHVKYPGKRVDNSFIPMRIEVSHQYVCKFNPTDLNDVHANDDAVNPLRATYSVKWIRVWHSTSTAEPGAAYSEPALPSGGVPVVDGTTFSVLSYGATAISGGNTNPLVMSAPAFGTTRLQGFFLPISGDGTWTAKIQQNMPGVDFYSSGLLLLNTTTGKMMSLGTLFAAGYSGYTTTWYGAGPQVLTSALIPATNRPWAGRARPHYERMVRVGNTVTFAGSQTGAAGSWDVLTGGDQTAVIGGVGNQIFVYVDAFDHVSNGRPAAITLSRWWSTTATNIQAEVL